MLFVRCQGVDWDWRSTPTPTTATANKYHTLKPKMYLGQGLEQRGGGGLDGHDLLGLWVWVDVCVRVGFRVYERTYKSAIPFQSIPFTSGT